MTTEEDLAEQMLRENLHLLTNEELADAFVVAQLRKNDKLLEAIINELHRRDKK